MKVIVYYSLLFLVVPCVHCTSSGLYVDNGFDQTIIQRSLSRKEKLHFERELSDLFGLPKRHRRLSNNSVIESAAPKFLLDIYNSLDSKSKIVNNEFNLVGVELRSVKESDSIITLLSHEKHISNVRHERGKRVWFDTSEVSATDMIVNAELRLYQMKQNVQSQFQYRISLYQVLMDYNGEKELEFVCSVNTTMDNEGWLVFNVTSSVVNWVAEKLSNRGFYISVHRISKSFHEMRPDDIGVVSTVTHENEEKQPFIVVFLRAGSEGNKVNTHRRVRRDTKRRKKSDTDASYAVNPFSTESAWTLRSCQIQTLYVNFKDLNWHEWIIAPDGYAAFYCSGTCDFPLNAHMNATNHAIVQTLVHLMDPLQVPKPCCAPTKLGSIAVLYYLEDGNVILKKYKNMIVKSCGCH